MLIFRCLNLILMVMRMLGSSRALFSHGVSRDVQNQEKVCAAVLAQTGRLLLRGYVSGCSEGWWLHEDKPQRESNPHRRQG